MVQLLFREEGGERCHEGLLVQRQIALDCSDVHAQVVHIVRVARQIAGVTGSVHRVVVSAGLEEVSVQEGTRTCD